MCLTLKDLCLNIIVSNIERYNLAFTSTADVDLKRNLEFLRKKYSSDIISRLDPDSNSLEEQYLDFLINKYLKSIDVYWLRDCSWDKFTSIIAEIGSNIEEIYFREFSEDLFEDIICYLTNLKRITFGDGFREVNLKHVANFCPDIEEIDIGECIVTFEAAKDLCTNESGKALCTKLKLIKICLLCKITEESLNYLLQNLPSLEIFDYHKLPQLLYSLHGREILAMNSLGKMSYNIHTLDFTLHCTDSPNYVDILKVCLTVCPHLKSLSCAVVNGDELDILSNLSNWEFLIIENFSKLKININEFLKCKGRKLTSLTLGNFHVSVSVIAESCPRVKVLNLNRAYLLSDNDSKPVFKSLTSCSFIGINVFKYVKMIDLLLSSTNKLESLSFKRCDLLSSEIEALILKYCKLYPIKKISFWLSRIQKDFVKDLLSSCHTLRHLDIEDCLSTESNEELLKFAETLCNKPKIMDQDDDFDNEDYNYPYEYDSSEESDN